MTQARRNARAYLKRKHVAQAELAGAEILDATIVAVDPTDGHYVIRLYSGEDLHLVLREKVSRPSPEDSPPVEPKPKAKKVFAPKSWPPAEWNRVVSTIQTKDFTKDRTRAELQSGTTIDDKQKRHAIAVIDALPDVPDWHAYLPLSEES